MKRKEQHAVLEVRKVLQRVRLAKPENIDALAKELEAALERESPKAGTQQEKVREEAEKALQQSRQRIAQINEAQKRLEEQKAEGAVKKKQNDEAATTLLKELEKLVEATEAAGKSLETYRDQFSEDKELRSAEIESAAKRITDMATEATEAHKACQTYVSSKRAVIGQVNMQECRAKVTQLMGRANAANRAVVPAAAQAEHARAQAAERAMLAREADKVSARSKAAAEEYMVEQRKLFAKYDKDRDARLNRPECAAYALGEFNHEATDETLDRIFRALVPEGETGVVAEDLQRLRVQVGVGREIARDVKRRAETERRREELEKQQEELRVELDESDASIVDAEARVEKFITEMREVISNGENMSHAEMAPENERAEAKVAEFEAEAASVGEKVAALATDVEALQTFLSPEKRKLKLRVGRLEVKVRHALAVRGSLSKRVIEKSRAEVTAFHATAVIALRRHLDASGLAADALFTAVCGGKEGEAAASQDDVLAFLKGLWESDKQFVEGAAARWFGEHFAEDGLSLEDLSRLTRVCYKVVKPTVMTDGWGVSGSAVVRRLDVDELLELLEGPKKDEEAGILRMQGRAAKDGKTGFVTVQGNAGTNYLEVGGDRFQVVKETILTDSIDLSLGSESVRKLKGSERKLKEGEVLEAIEFARKDEASGLMRMKVKTQSDGVMGWATVVGNQGTAFLQVL